MVATAASVWLVLAAAALAALASASMSSFSFASFASRDISPDAGVLHQQGGVEVLDGMLRLTTGTGERTGLVWHKTQALVRGFETKFSFQITSGASNSAQGLVFVINAFGYDNLAVVGGEYLGYHGLANSFAVEFDCIKSPNADNRPQIEGDSHVSVHTMGQAANQAFEDPASQVDWQNSRLSPMCSGTRINARIRYEPRKVAVTDGTASLAIYLNYAGTGEFPVLVLSGVALEEKIALLANSDSAYIGFTGTTVNAANEDIYSWSYQFLGVASAGSTAEGPGLSATIAGVDGTFEVAGQDQYGNTLLVGGSIVNGSLVSLDNSYTARLSTTDLGNGHYTVSYSVTRSGQYTLNVLASNVPIVGSPFSVFIRPAAISNRYTTIVDGEVPTNTTAGTAFSFTLQAADMYGNTITDGDDSAAIQASLQGPVSSPSDSVTLQNMGGGRYLIRAVLTVKQTYSLIVTVNQLAIPSFPRRVVVAPGIVSAQMSRVTDIPPTPIANVGYTINLQACDQYGNTLDTSTTGFAVELTPTNADNTAVLVDRGTGAYTINMKLKTSQQYDLKIFLNGADVAQSPYKILAYPAEPDVASCAASGDGLIKGVAGETSVVTVQVRDVFQNNYFQSPGNFSLKVDVSGSETLSSTVRDVNDGKLAYRFMPTKTGMLVITVTSVDGQTSVQNTPSRATVVSGTAQATSSYIPTTYDVSKAHVNQVFFFLVQTMDAFGNTGNTGGDQVQATVTPVDTARQQPAITPTVFDGNNGTFSVSFTAAPDNYGEYKMAITINGAPMKGSPFDLTIIGEDKTNVILWAVCVPLVLLIVGGAGGYYYYRRRQRKNDYMLVETQPESLISSGKSAVNYSLMPE